MAMSANKLEKPADNHGRLVMGHQPIENLEVNGKSSKYNLRKSLAWDSAFFTSAGTCLWPLKMGESFFCMIHCVVLLSFYVRVLLVYAGVLDPAELSNIMESVDRSEKLVKLPRIQEDVNLSCESLSTLSDSLESLEADLFEDIRASIQKSSNKSTVGNGSSKLVSSGSQFHTSNRKSFYVIRK